MQVAHGARHGLVQERKQQSAEPLRANPVTSTTVTRALHEKETTPSIAIEDNCARRTLTAEQRAEEKNRKGRERSMRTRLRNRARLLSLEANCSYLSTENRLFRGFLVDATANGVSPQLAFEFVSSHCHLHRNRPPPYAPSVQTSWISGHSRSAISIAHTCPENAGANHGFLSGMSSPDDEYGERNERSCPDNRGRQRSPAVSETSAATVSMEPGSNYSHISLATSHRTSRKLLTNDENPNPRSEQERAPNQSSACPEHIFCDFESLPDLPLPPPDDWENVEQLLSLLAD